MLASEEFTAWLERALAAYPNATPSLAPNDPDQDYAPRTDPVGAALDRVALADGDLLMVMVAYVADAPGTRAEWAQRACLAANLLSEAVESLIAALPEPESLWTYEGLDTDEREPLRDALTALLAGGATAPDAQVSWTLGAYERKARESLDRAGDTAGQVFEFAQAQVARFDAAIDAATGEEGR